MIETFNTVSTQAKSLLSSLEIVSFDDQKWWRDWGERILITPFRITKAPTHPPTHWNASWAAVEEKSSVGLMA